MNKKIVLFLIFLNYNTSNATIIDEIQLPEPRIQNLVICNDSSEFYINEDQFPLPWTKTSQAISSDLLFALSADQLVLSTKSVWHNVQFLAQLWLDFATLSTQELTTKYQALSKQPTTEFVRDLNRYQPCIKEIHALYQIMNNVIKTHITQPLPEISRQINNALKPSWAKHPEWLQDGDLKNNLLNIFTTFTLYQLALANHYTCKDVSNDFVLFIPQSLMQTPPLDHRLHTITNQQNTSNADIFMGLRFTHYTNYDYLTELTIHQAQIMAKKLIMSKDIGGGRKLLGHKDLGAELYTLLNQILIKKSSLKTQFQDHFAEIIPNFNIFVAGHGSSNMITANILVIPTKRTRTITVKSKSGKIETKTITYQSSDFLEILDLLNKQTFMKSLTVSSCYPGGKKIKEEFNITSKFDSPILENITYPIILLGSTLAPTRTTFWLTSLPPFNNVDISDHLYLKQRLYGPKKINNQESFVRFFNFLNGTATYEKYTTPIKNKHIDPNAAHVAKTRQHYRLQDPTKNLPALETFSYAKPSYLYAANVFAYIYDTHNEKMHPESFANYILIKFPHTSWFTPARFKKLVLKLSQVVAVTKAQMMIPKETQAILMDANYIPAHIFIQQATPIPFIPLNYLNQNYVFEAISTTQSMPLEQFVRQFFTIEHIAEPINIVIKKLTLGAEQYTNIYLFIHNNFGAQGIRNGYAFTSPAGQTSMTHWDNNQPFGTNVKTEPYTPANLAAIIATTTNNATKQFDTKTKEVIAKSGKKHEIVTSGSPSKETMNQFEKTIASLQGKGNVSPKVQEMVNRSRKQYEEEEDQKRNAQKQLAIIKALELASLLTR